VKPVNFSAVSAVCATSILGLGLVCGFSNTPAVRQHADEVDSVNNALSVNGFSNVNVSQNRTTGVMTLTGLVASPDQKAQAAKIVSTNASDYTIANSINVAQSTGQTKAASDSENNQTCSTFAADQRVTDPTYKIGSDWPAQDRPRKPGG
jgi:osmotically-inducible protein OsmY